MSQANARVFFKDIQNVQSSSQNGRPFEPGSYTLKVQELRFFLSKRDRREVFVADMIVVESSNPEFKPGDYVTYVTKVNNFPTYFQADVKAFISAAGPCPEDQVDAEVIELAVSSGQPMRGNKLRAIVGLKDDGPYKTFRFMPE